ncbi:MAG: protein YgfX [Candidatus Thiodiazotropha sp.]
MSGKIQALTLQPRPSRKLHACLVAVHLLALLVILLAPMLPWHRAMLLLILTLQGYLSYRQTRKGSGRRIIRARIRPDGRARITMGDGRKLAARIRQDTLITPWLILLRFDLDRGWRQPALLLIPGSLSEDEMRRLRVLLRFSQLNPDGGEIDH